MKKKTILIIVICTFLMIVSIVIIRSLFGETPVENGETYVVQFYDNKNTVLKKEEVQYGENAVSPYYNPNIPNQVFIGWDKSFNDVKEDLNIYPVMEDIFNEANVIYSSYSCSNGEGVIQISFQITGNVNFCCLELEIDYDEKYLQYIAATNIDGDAIVNSKQGELYYVFACGENINGDVDLITLEFKVLKESENTDLMKLNVLDIASFKSDNDFMDEQYKIIIGDIVLN